MLNSAVVKRDRSERRLVTRWTATAAHRERAANNDGKRTFEGLHVLRGQCGHIPVFGQQLAIVLRVQQNSGQSTGTG